MTILISIPIFIFLLMIQTTIISQIPLINGTADLLLIVVVSWAIQKDTRTGLIWGLIAGLLTSIVSSLPGFVPIIGYTLSAGISIFMKRLTWKVTFLALITALILSTIVYHSFTILVLKIIGNPLPIKDAINLITLPSIILNLLFMIPIYAIINDLAKTMHPKELEV